MRKRPISYLRSRKLVIGKRLRFHFAIAMIKVTHCAWNWDCAWARPRCRVFLPRDVKRRARYCYGKWSVCLSVCLSVRLSVRPWRWGIV